VSKGNRTVSQWVRKVLKTSRCLAIFAALSTCAVVLLVTLLVLLPSSEEETGTSVRLPEDGNIAPRFSYNGNYTDLIIIYICLHKLFRICTLTVPFKTQPQRLHMNPFTHTTTKQLEILTSCNRIQLSLDGHLSQKNSSCIPKFCYQSVYCRQNTIAKFLMNRSKRFWCNVIFENGHTIVRICTASAPLVWAAA
jgi:hypothetical protein